MRISRAADGTRPLSGVYARVMRPVGLCITALALLAAPSAAGAADLQLHYGVPGGTGSLIVSGGDGPVSWERCTDVCVAVDDGDGQDQVLRIQDATAGATFKATRGELRATSEPWRGALTLLTPPTVEGELRVGSSVRPIAAHWGGGWGSEGDWLQLQACTSPEATDCPVISDEIKFACQPSGGRVLPARYAGSWLRVVDVRLGRDTMHTMEGYHRPEGVRPNQAGPGAAASLVGQIQSGPAPSSDCGSDQPGAPSGPTGPSGPTAPPALPAPGPPAARAAATIRPIVLRLPGRRPTVAQIRCSAVCRVVLRARRGRSTVWVTRNLPEGGGEIALPSDAARWRPGRIGVRVRIDGRVVAERGAMLGSRA